VIKSLLFGAIRSAHVVCCRRPLPRRLGIYAHSLEPAERDGLRTLVRALKERGYVFVLPAEFQRQDDRLVAYLSFDDNYASWHDSLGLLDELGIKVAFYLNVGPLRGEASEGEIARYFDRIVHGGDRRSLSRDEVLDLHRSGHVIGSHTEWHDPLRTLAFPDACRSIQRGKERLEDLLGSEVPHFAYPFGMPRHFSADLEAFCRSIGIATVAAATPGLQYATRMEGRINRTPCRLHRSVSYQLNDFRIDGRLFTALTGRSAVG
jgi:peptidoglycan/xylan/chitin deacetylase (PgdA/CDA1 family)